MKKSELRKEIKNRKRQFTSQQLSELSFAVIMRLLAHQRLKDARTVMLYYSLPDEVYTHTLVDALLASGKRVLLPRVTGEGTMELRLYTGPQSLEQGAYNIMEPVGEVFKDYAQIDLAVICQRGVRPPTQPHGTRQGLLRPTAAAARRRLQDWHLLRLSAG